MGDYRGGARGAELALIAQEPLTAFSPVHTIGNQIIEAIMLLPPAILSRVDRRRGD